MGEHDFLIHLKEDHQKQKQIGENLVDAKDTSERARLRKELYKALYPHMIGEEASIFAKLKKSEDEETRDDALEGLQEHHVGKILLRELMQLQTSSEIFKAKTKVLDELNRHHIQEEEGGVFEHLKRLSTQELDTLFKQYKEAEEESE